MIIEAPILIQSGASYVNYSLNVGIAKESLSPKKACRLLTLLNPEP